MLTLKTAMQIPLHIKTTLLASGVILFVMVITLAFFGTRVVNRLQVEQKNFAEAQAESLAEKISDVLPLDDYARISRLVEIFDKARIGKGDENAIRIWEYTNNGFVKRIKTSASDSVDEMPSEAANALQGGRETKIEESDGKKSIYRVFVPLGVSGRLAGAVEFTEQLDDLSSLTSRYFLTEMWLAFVFIIVFAMVIYFLTRYYVYRPLSKISGAMQIAKTGELEVRADVSGTDEFGRLGTELNRMLSEIEEFSKEREKQNEILGEKVKEATAELATRNTQLEQANAEIWQATSRLSEVEKLAAAGQTAAQFAHEVGTPLNLISGHVQLLRMKSGNDESAQKRLDIIGSQIERIEGIVRSMLDKTRFGDVAYESLDINEIVRGILEVVAPKLDAGRIICRFNRAEGDLTIEGNAGRLQQVFLNLINNAVDAMPDGGELRLTTGRLENEVFVEITDNGTGMDEATRKRIFDPLFTTKSRGQGTGLGLVVVRQILPEHHARISVESERGQGTSFKVFFPGLDKQNYEKNSCS